MNVFFTQSARNAIVALASYLADEIKMPETAEKYANRMFEFGAGLGAAPNAHTICKEIAWAKRNLRCAIFD